MIKNAKNESLSYHEFYYENVESENFYKVVDFLPFNTYFERPAMLSFLPDLKEKKILDAGCAAGWYIPKFISLGAKSVTAIDFSENMIIKAKERVGPDILFYKADLNNGLPFLESNSFDIVFSSLTLDYVKNWNQIMAEFYRVLNPKGYLVFSVQHPFEPFALQHIDTYYQTILFNHNYTKFGKETTIKYYKRPLNEILNPVITAGFYMDEILEPVPINKFKEVCPEYWDITNKQPEFLMVKARKI